MSELILLATEATAEGGGNPSATIAVVVLLLALGAFGVAYLVVGPGRSRGVKTRGDIPLAMRPYHSDEELETTGLERAMAWGVALSVFAAIFIPLVWVIEPQRISEKRTEFYERDTAFGREQYAGACVSCHGANAEGGSAPHPEFPEITTPWPAPQLNNIVARYEGSEVVTDVREFIITTLKQGRPGTPMPAWGAAYNGPMNDQQIEAIADYILSIQTGELEEVDATAFVGQSGEDLFGSNCARCHGENAEGRVGPQLINVFERYGAEEGDAESIAQVREHLLYTLQVGRYVPTGAPMPSFQGVLTEDAMKRIIDYIESIQQTGGPSYGQLGGDPNGSDE